MSQNTPFIRRLRAAVLAALVLSVAGLVGLYYFGRAGKTTVPVAEEPTDPEVKGKETKAVGKGFDYMVTHGDLPAFRIRGEKVRSDQDDNVELEQVSLGLFRDNQQTYEVFGESATYNRESRAASITGLVRVTGPNGMELHAQRLELSPGGQTLKSTGPVSFRMADTYQGDSSELEADLATDTLSLRGGVALSTDPSAPTQMSLESQRLEFDRPNGVARIEGGVTLKRGLDVLSAVRFIVQLESDGKTPKQIDARGDITGEIHGIAPDSAAVTATVSRISGDRLKLTFVPESRDPSGIELEGPPGGTARLESFDEGSIDTARRLVAPLFTGQFANGLLSSAQAMNGVVVEEPDGHGSLRRATARRADAAFQDGKLSNVTLEGDVVLVEPRVRANGDRAYYDMAAKRAELFGKDARATSERGDLQAPHIVYNQATGILKADGGVKGLVRQERGSGMAGTPLARGEGPIRVESAEATWQDSPRTFFFRGNVRAWRGSNLLAAEQLQGDEDAGVLTAGGNVKTVWVPEPKTGADAKSTAPIEVNANTLVYHREQHVATYSGDVRVRQESRTLTCDEARIELDADNRAKVMNCTGNVKMDDPAENRRATAATAKYDVDAKNLTMEGNPVELTDPIRGKASGRRLIYDVSKGTMHLLSTTADTPPPAQPTPPPAAPPKPQKQGRLR